MNKTLVLWSLVIGFVLVSDASLACQCVETRSVAHSVESSDAVFSGRVLKIYGTRIGFAVERSWKGVNEPELTIYTPAQSTACGYQFEEGQDYLVYAYSQGGERLGTDTCTRTRKLAEAKEDLTELGNGKAIGQR
jgi:hypothetical protein